MKVSFSKATCLALLLAVPLLLVAVPVPAENESDKIYVIGPGDMLEIQVWDHEDLHRKVEVSQQGTFSFPLIGNVDVRGLSLFELENSITQRLAGGYLVRPQVNISVLEYRSQRVFLFGEVKKPGTYVVKGSLQLVELLSQAGGLTENAGTKVTIVRPLSSRQAGPVALQDAKETELKEIDLDQIKAGANKNQTSIISGDSVYVLEALRVYVTGYVNKPGDFRWEKGLTVRQAIIMAGGANKWGSDTRANVVRLENEIEKEFEVKLEDMVMPSDIIKVPAPGLFEAKEAFTGKESSLPVPVPSGVLKPLGVRERY